MLVILARKGVIPGLIPAARQVIRRHVATRRAAGQQPGKIRGPRHGRPGAAPAPAHPWTGTDAGIRMRTSPATPGAMGLSEAEGSRPGHRPRILI
jgi:hypothetical protein